MQLVTEGDIQIKLRYYWYKDIEGDSIECTIIVRPEVRYQKQDEADTMYEATFIVAVFSLWMRIH